MQIEGAICWKHGAAFCPKEEKRIRHTVWSHFLLVLVHQKSSMHTIADVEGFAAANLLGGGREEEQTDTKAISRSIGI